MLGSGFADFGMNENEFRNRYQRRRRTTRQQPENRTPLQQIIQFMPILMILSYLILNSLMVKSPYFSFQKTSKFPYKRTTSGLNVQYFVAADFYEKYSKVA